MYEGGSVIGDYIKDERTSRVIRLTTNNVIPALFQTADYARALFTARGINEVDEAVRKWMERQAIFRGPNPPNITAIIDQAAFFHPPARVTMPEQVEKLIDLAQLPCVRIRIIEKEANWHIGLDGDLTIFTANGAQRTYIGGQLGTLPVTSAKSGDLLEVIWEEISEVALSSSKSLQLLKMIAKEVV
ncbi:DUF5753 domain-containing protein [Actinomadura harenae]|nr:DUF5753 domain-containing protein [Actinomadura harenae]